MKRSRVDDPVIAAVPISPTMHPLGLTGADVADILDFLRDGLTEPRAANELPPFDRPKLRSEP